MTIELPDGSGRRRRAGAKNPRGGGCGLLGRRTPDRLQRPAERLSPPGVTNDPARPALNPYPRPDPQSRAMRHPRLAGSLVLAAGFVWLSVPPTRSAAQQSADAFRKEVK